MFYLYRVSKWIIFFIITTLYALSILEVIDLENKLPEGGYSYFYSFIILNSFVYGFFLLTVFFGKKAKVFLKNTFWLDPKFQYDFCKGIKTKKVLSLNIIFLVLLVLTLIPLIITTVFYFQDFQANNKRPIVHLWIGYFILVYVWISLHDFCKIKIETKEKLFNQT
ncbi:hypothetical protein NV226_02570 [Mycoplasma iguanae]|uniref:Uncharacterized protein n=1 Tax=Mycoplasma iguanae TaxID=292461 RepID=A0ABY5R8U1_9MOLU|nr:hypothetical protein [Mycoplasma iguanae]UVD81587.1 hypothetical protein NV226_02570 [Mycoplasma iguanae]